MIDSLEERKKHTDDVLFIIMMDQLDIVEVKIIQDTTRQFWIICLRDILIIILKMVSKTLIVKPPRILRMEDQEIFADAGILLYERRITIPHEQKIKLDKASRNLLVSQPVKEPSKQEIIVPQDML